MRSHFLGVVLIAVGGLLPKLAAAESPPFVEPPPLIESFLLDGRLAEGIAASHQRLADHPDDVQTRFGLAVAEFLQAVEHLGQSLYRHGALGSRSWLGRMLPIVRLPVPENEQPVGTSAADVRELIQVFLTELAVAEKTLASLSTDEVSLPLHVGQIHLDFNADGTVTADESGWQLFQTITNGRRGNRAAGGDRATEIPPDVKAFVVKFDRGDAYWLQGYCHLLSGFAEAALAHDADAFFNVIAPYLFAQPTNPDLPPEMFRETSRELGLPVEDLHIADLVAAVHETRFPLVEPARMTRSLHHLKQVLALSRLTWQAIEAETDNEAEWIPNTRQTCVVPGMQVTAEMMSGWQKFLDEAEDILAGEKLVPHWRLRDGYGINLQRVFVEPRDFDLVRWAQGAAAVPYVSQGPCTDRKTWSAIQRSFRGQFLSFAVWFN